MSVLVDAVVSSFGDQASVDHLDGVTVDLGSSTWFNLRSSNTEPLLRLNVEAPDAAAVDAVVAQVSTTIAENSQAATAAEKPRS